MYICIYIYIHVSWIATEVERFTVYEYFFSATILIELIQIHEYTLNLIPPLASGGRAGEGSGRWWGRRSARWWGGKRAQASPLRPPPGRDGQRRRGAPRRQAQSWSVRRPADSRHQSRGFRARYRTINTHIHIYIYTYIYIYIYTQVRTRT